MKIGIMQPYFFPYIGYWQLMKLTDRYVIYDDVNYIKGGWINRNRILINGKATYLHLPVRGASPYKKINQVGVEISPRFLDKTSRSLHGAYARAPYYREVYPDLMRLLDYPTENLSDYLDFQIRGLAKRLGIKTEFVKTPELHSGDSLSGEARVIAVVKTLGGDLYYNAIGGRSLYSFENFRKNGLTLRFVEREPIIYRQWGGRFVPDLSIIDVLMFNGWEQTKVFLDKVRIYGEKEESHGEHILENF